MMKDIYVKFGQNTTGEAIVGESRDQGAGGQHTSPWLEVNSWSHLIRQPKSATASTAGGHTSERCEHGEMIFTKDLDSTSPQLWQACSAGTTYKTIDIEFFRASGTSSRVKYLKIQLINAIISSVTPAVVDEGLPSETFGLKYAAVQWVYTKQNMDGSVGASTTTMWNLATNAPTFAASQ
jgi:type VI secretion system secreted protein Hcp